MCSASAVPVSLERVRVLLISAVPEDHVALQHIFDRSAWRLRRVTTCRDALADICENGTPVVVCERELPDGDWRLVLSELESLPLRPNVIVTSRLADDSLWAEVLNVGAYDLLAQPFDADEVVRVVFLAWHEQNRRAHACIRRQATVERSLAAAG